MKSARERAEELAVYHAPRNGKSYQQLVSRFETSFKEYARDQRHIIAELQSANDALPVTTRDAHAIAMNAPAPGE